MHAWFCRKTLKERGVFGRSRHQGKAKYIMDFKMLGREGVDSIHLSQDRKKRRAIVNTVMMHREGSGHIK
jgi:hypothetical protein